MTQYYFMFLQFIILCRHFSTNACYCFLSRNLVDPRFSPVLVPAAEMILDIYQTIIGQSTIVDRQLQRLHELLEREVDLQQSLLEALGMLDTIFSSALPRKEVPCSVISRSNGLTQEESASTA